MHPAAAVALLATLAGVRGSAAIRPAGPAPIARRVTVAAGAHYGADPLRRALLGSGYRHLWVTPIRVDVLDLRSFAGGLRPTKAGGGKQTRSLHFESADGRRFKVRSVDKRPGRVIKPELRPLVENLVEDTTSALVPGGTLAVAPLLAAAGVLHVEPRLVVVPDDALLGEFREEFAGMLGQLEEVPREGVTPGFEQVSEIVDWEELLTRLERSPGPRVDARAFLKARLVDLIVGDWDRHELQWEWAKVAGVAGWQPMPTDRDQAFSRFDGLLIDLVRLAQPRLVKFDDGYPNIAGLTWNARFIDRRLLAELEWTAWQETIGEVQARLTDAVIEDAVGNLPPEYVRLEGRRLGRALKRRRDLLPGAARRHYELLAEEVAIEATDAGERAEVIRTADGGLEVELAADSDPAYFRRRFLPGETREVRLLLRHGDDRLKVSGGPTEGILLRAAGGPGDDVLDDSAGRARLYDAEGENRVVLGPGTRFDARPYEHPRDAKGNPLRDWGRAVTPVAWLIGAPDLGALLGGGIQATRYGFRRHPFQARHVLRGAYSTGARALGIEYEGEFRRINSRRHSHLVARVSGFEVVRFHGFGNETKAVAPSRFYKVDQRQILVAPLMSLPVPGGEVNIGPELKFQHTVARPGRFISASPPYGAGDFGQAGLLARLLVDTRAKAAYPRRGLRLDLQGSAYPEVWSVASAFGEVHASAATYLSAGLPLKPTLALRAGGKQVWGRYPFHEAAFLGGATLRGLRPQRYAGDASVFGNAELRVKVGPVGAFALADVGRVYLAGERSRRWHAATGGGLRLGLPGGEKAVVLTAATSEGKWRLSVGGAGGF